MASCPYLYIAPAIFHVLGSINYRFAESHDSYVSRAMNFVYSRLAKNTDFTRFLFELTYIAGPRRTLISRAFSLN